MATETTMVAMRERCERTICIRSDNGKLQNSETNVFISTRHTALSILWNFDGEIISYVFRIACHIGLISTRELGFPAYLGQALRSLQL